MLTDAVASIAEHWEDVLQHLSAEDRQLLTVAVRDLLSSCDEGSRAAAARRLVDRVARALPASHPVRRALAKEVSMLDSAVPRWDIARQGLLARISPPDVVLGSH